MIAFMISILIATKDRPNKLLHCLQSIFSCNDVTFEIIVIDQSSTGINNSLLSSFSMTQRKKIIYMTQRKANKARALNTAIKVSRYPILAFTDDDCIVDKLWLKQIERHFRLHPDHNGVFGNVMPYAKTKTKSVASPSCLVNMSVIATSDPYVVQHEVLGNGNNMVIRKSAILSLGREWFREWLGDGSVCQAGGIENEVVYRLLRNGSVIAHDPSVKIFHDRWLASRAFKTLTAKYCCGYSAFIIYSAIKYGDIHVLQLLVVMMRDSLRDVQQYLQRGGTFIVRSKEMLSRYYFFSLRLLFIAKGVCVGSYFGFLNRAVLFVNA